MYYEDLTPYRIERGPRSKWIDIFPTVRNVGWLDKDRWFSKGKVSSDWLKKLKELTFTDLKNTEDRTHGRFDKKKAVVVHMLHMGSIYLCSLCTPRKKINLDPSGLRLYMGVNSMILGRSQMCIPAVDGECLYASPSMLYHYIADHNYLPPTEFLKAVEAFDIDNPYDSDEKGENLKDRRILISDLHAMDGAQALANKSRIPY